MIQDIAPHHYDNTYHPEPPCADSFVLYYEGRNALVVHDGDEISFPRFRDLEAQNPGIYEQYTYLFSIDDERFYLLEDLVLPKLSSDTEPGRYYMDSIMTFRGAKPRYLGFAGITGHQLAAWYQSRRFCGHCGTPMQPDAKERMMYCPKCRQIEYPKICPAVIIGVTDGNRLLISQYAGRAYKGYALIAGFAEIGESLEETVKREVMEEVGLKVTNLRYYKSQPWPFTDSLLAGFFCDLAEPGEIRLQEDELAMARWYEREDVPLQDPTRASLTQEMIRMFKEGKV